MDDLAKYVPLRKRIVSQFREGESPYMEMKSTSRRPLNAELFNVEDYRIYRTDSTTQKTGSDLFNHQEVFRHLILSNDRMLLTHKPGTGKTITQISAMCYMVQIGMLKGFYIVNNNDIQNQLAKKYVMMCCGSSRASDIKFFKTFKYEKLEEFIDQFEDDYGIVLDEAHNLISSGAKTEKKDKTVRALVDHISKSKNVKLIVTTSTPVTNSYDGALTLLSLIEGRMIESSEFPTLESLLEHIKENHQSSISYIEPNYKDVEIVQRGKKYRINIEGDNGIDEIFELGITTSYLKGAQLADFIMLPKVNDFYAGIKKISISSIRDVCTPGNEGNPPKFKDKIIWKEGGYFHNESLYNERDKDSFDDELERASLYSAKFATLMKKAEDSKHCIAIYMELKEAGANRIGQYLENFGYSQYNKKDPETKAKRYMLYTPDSSEKVSGLALLNSQKNVCGEYIKFIVGSKTMRDSVDIHNCDQIHILTPEWHITGFIQVWFRIIRNGGQRFMIDYLAREIAEKEQISYGDALKRVNEEKIKLNIFNHVLHYRRSDLDSCRPYLNQETRNLDDDELMELLEERETEKKIYQIALDKYEQIGPLMRTIRETSVDRYINSNEVPQSCSKEIDSQVNDVCFIKRNIQICTNPILRILNAHPSIHLSVLYKELSNELNITKDVMDYTVFFLVEYMKKSYFPQFSRELNILLYDCPDPVLFLSDSRQASMSEFTKSSVAKVSPHYEQVEYSYVYGILRTHLVSGYDITESMFDPSRTRPEANLDMILEFILLSFRNKTVSDKKYADYVKFLEYFDEFWSVDDSVIHEYMETGEEPDLSEIVFYVFPSWISNPSIHYHTFKNYSGKPKSEAKISVKELSPSSQKWEPKSSNSKNVYLRRVTMDVKYQASIFEIDGVKYVGLGFGLILFLTNEQYENRYDRDKIIIKKYNVYDEKIKKNAIERGRKAANDNEFNSLDKSKLKRKIKDMIKDENAIYKESFYYGDFGTHILEGYPDSILNIKLRIILNRENNKFQKLSLIEKKIESKKQKNKIYRSIYFGS